MSIAALGRGAVLLGCVALAGAVGLPLDRGAAQEPVAREWRGTLVVEEGESGLDVVLAVPAGERKSFTVEGQPPFSVSDVSHAGSAFGFTLAAADGAYRCELQQQAETGGYSGPCFRVTAPDQLLGRLLIFPQAAR